MTWFRIWIHFFQVRIQDPDPDPHKNEMDPLHCNELTFGHRCIFIEERGNIVRVNGHQEEEHKHRKGP